MTHLSLTKDRDGSTMTGVTRLTGGGEVDMRKMYVWTLHERSDGYRNQGKRLRDVFGYMCGYVCLCLGRPQGLNSNGGARVSDWL